MKAYITIYKKDRTIEKVVWGLTEAERKLSKKDYMKLVEFGGLRNSKMNGYIA